MYLDTHTESHTKKDIDERKYKEELSKEHLYISKYIGEEYMKKLTKKNAKRDILTTIHGEKYKKERIKNIYGKRCKKRYT